MCGRYTLHNIDKLAKHYNLARLDPSIHENFNASPGQQMPVVTQNQEGKTVLELMKWGLIPGWSKDPKIGYKLINARAESIFEKPIWRNIILKRRCLIPADGFYEWQKQMAGKKELKQPLYIHPKQSSLFSFAGVWETWKDVEGKEHKTYSIITTEPNKEMAAIHNRMPVILHPEDEASWIAPTNMTRDSIEPLLRPFEDNGLKIYEVSRDVNASRTNDKHLIYPLIAQ